MKGSPSSDQPSLADHLFRGLFWCAYRAALLVWTAFGVRTKGVTVGIIHEDELLLVRHSYKAGLELPGGGTDRGEAPRDTARRELKEELGLDVPAEALLEIRSTVHRLFRREVEETHFEWRPARRPTVRIDRREIVDAGFFRLERLAEAELGYFVRFHRNGLSTARDGGSSVAG